MKRQIRRGTFETNSSSTHAICIAKDDYELKDHIDFHTGEYGWECKEYGDLDNIFDHSNSFNGKGIR